MIFEPLGLGQTIKVWVWKLQHSWCSPARGVASSMGHPGAAPQGTWPHSHGASQVLGDAESSPGVLWAFTARKTVLSSRMSSDPTGEVLEVGWG